MTDDIMIGEFIARWEDAADGVVMDADTAQALAREFKRLTMNAARTTPIDDEGLLDQLAENTNLDLTWGPVNGDVSDCAWHVHRVNGGYNDREWTLVATGETPSEALRKALDASNVS